jgi:hypothetical protein
MLIFASIDSKYVRYIASRRLPVFREDCDQRHSHPRTASKRHPPLSLQLETARSQRRYAVAISVYFY